MEGTIDSVRVEAVTTVFYDGLSKSKKRVQVHWRDEPAMSPAGVIDMYGSCLLPSLVPLVQDDFLVDCPELS